MNWQLSPTAYTANAETSFVKMRIFVDMPNTKGLDSVRYVAHVETLIGTSLASKDNIATMPEAQAWCVIAYSKLLSTEQERVRDALAHTGLEAQRLGELMLGID
jgi:hypothetical protein